MLVLVAAIMLLYRETGLAMIGIWSRSDTFAHVQRGHGPEMLGR